MAIGWSEPVRAYCERADGTFWGEPFGAVSNAAFLIAAAAAARRAWAAGDRAGLALAGLIAVIGVGSFLFHTLAVFWTMLADVTPIALFVLAYFGHALRRFFNLRRTVVRLAVLAFAVLAFGLTPALEAASGLALAELTNGSLDYLPALVALAGVAAALAAAGDRAGRDAAPRLGGLAALFLVSVALRTADRAACPFVPTGTHWLWHVLNAAVLYGLVAVAARHRAARTAIRDSGAVSS